MSIRMFLITVLYCIAGSVYAQEDISGLKKDSLKTISNEYLNSENPTVKPFAVKEKMPEIKPETDIPQMEIQEIRYPRPFICLTTQTLLRCSTVITAQMGRLLRICTAMVHNLHYPELEESTKPH